MSLVCNIDVQITDWSTIDWKWHFNRN